MSGEKTMLFCVSCLVFIALNAQVALAVNGGKVYALGFFNLTSGSASTFGSRTPVFEEILISCYNCNTQVKVSIPSLNITKLYNLTSAVWNVRYDIDQEISTAIEFPVDLKWKNLAVVVSSLNASISVHVSKSRPGSVNAYLALPITWNSNAKTNPTDQSYEYYIASYNASGLSAITLASIYNDTCVTVFKHFKKNPNALVSESGQVRYQSITMQANDVFNMYSTDMDFTGLAVVSKKPIAVFGGRDNAQIPVGVQGYDAIMEQMPEARRLLGATYILTSVPGLPNAIGIRARVIGTVANTDVITFEYRFDTSSGQLMSVDRTDVRTVTILSNSFSGKFLGNSEFVEITAGSSTNFTVLVINCPNGCSVVQYVQGYQSTPSAAPLYQDPAMVIVPPPVRYTKDITFATSSVNYGSLQPAINYLSIIANNVSYSDLMLDNQPFSSWPTPVRKWFPVNLTSEEVYYATTVGPITAGFHTLTTNRVGTDKDKYTAFVYGFGIDANFPMAYAYLAGYDIPDTNLQPDDGPWYDMTQPAAVTTPAAGAVTTAAPAQQPQSEGPVEPRPSFGLIFLANFTAIDPSFAGKVPDRLCSNAYAEYFIYRIRNLNSDVATYPNPSWAPFKDNNPDCAASGIDVTLSVGNITSNVYFSEYSRAAGFFIVNITGTGDATLSDIYKCAKSASVWIANPNNWIKDYNKLTTHFLLKSNPDIVNLPWYPNLQGCAEMYLSNSGGLLALYSQNWVCPLTTTSVFGSGVRYQSHMAVLSIAFALVQLALTKFSQ